MKGISAQNIQGKRTDARVFLFSRILIRQLAETFFDGQCKGEKKRFFSESRNFFNY
jgi:hypothetical protein